MPARSTAYCLCTLALTLIISSTATAAPFTVPVDSAQSSLTFELCVAGTCDDDTSAVNGTMTIALNNVDLPAEITLYDFDLALSDTINLSLSWSIFGSLSASITNGAIVYAAPRTSVGPEPVTADAFLFTAVPSLAEGIMQYTASGIPCTALGQSGLPCSDSRNLADEGAQDGDITGQVTSAGRVVALTFDIDVTAPIDAENPSLGDIHVYGTVYGEMLVPRPLGDVDGDGDVDLGDLEPLTLCLGGPEILTAPTECSAYHFAGSDLDNDGDADLIDFAIYQEAFTP